VRLRDPPHCDKAAMNGAQPTILFRKVCKRTIDDRPTRHLLYRRAETEIVPIRISDGKLAQSPGLINGSGVDRRIGA
jgi:hypothetical protein